MNRIAVVKNNVKYASWISMVNACQSSGMPIKTWCRVNNIGIRTYYYRLHRVREMFLEQNSDMVTQEIAKLPVVPISEPVTNSVTIHCGYGYRNDNYFFTLVRYISLSANFIVIPQKM